LVIVGPERLPQVFRFVGKQYGKAIRASNDLKRAFMLEADRQDSDRRVAILRERRQQAKHRVFNKDHGENHSIPTTVTTHDAVGRQVSSPTEMPVSTPTRGDQIAADPGDHIPTDGPVEPVSEDDGVV